MAEIDDGGFVYPKIEMGEFNGKTLLTMVKQGITRRDECADRIAVGVMDAYLNMVVDDFGPSDVADLAYKIADALIAEGKKNERS